MNQIQSKFFIETFCGFCGKGKMTRYFQFGKPVLNLHQVSCYGYDSRSRCHHDQHTVAPHVGLDTCICQVLSGIGCIGNVSHITISTLNSKVESGPLQNGQPLVLYARLPKMFLVHRGCDTQYISVQQPPYRANATLMRTQPSPKTISVVTLPNFLHFCGLHSLADLYHYSQQFTQFCWE